MTTPTWRPTRSPLNNPPLFSNSPNYRPLFSNSPGNLFSGDGLALRAQTNVQTSPVSSFERHHTIRIEYPNFELREEGDEELCLYPLYEDPRTQDRFEPLPLIRNNAVIAHTDRDSQAEASLFCRTRATKILGQGELPDPPPGTLSDFQGLKEEIKLVSLFAGSTVLSIWTFRTPRRPGSIMLRFGVASSFQMQRFQMPEERFECDFREVEADLGSHLLTPDWLQLVWMALHRSTDRSYRHVRFQLDWQASPESERRIASYGFKPRRKEDFGRLLESKVCRIDPAALPIEDRSCMICMEILGTTAAPIAVGLPCNDQGLHAICTQCLLAWVDSKGTGEANCPKCRKLIFEPGEIQDLAFGLVNGIYQLDSLYTPFENFERSCADLDQELAEDSNSDIFVNAALLMRIWGIICAGTWSEVNGEPQLLRLLNPIAYPEWTIIRQGLGQRLSLLDGLSGRTGDLFKALVSKVFEELRKRYYYSGLYHHANNEDLRQLIGDPTKAACLDLPPGFEEVFRRCLNRSLRFIQIRQCKCTSGMHKHGLRDYYNPDDNHSDQREA